MAELTDILLRAVDSGEIKEQGIDKPLKILITFTPEDSARLAVLAYKYYKETA